MEKEMIEYDIVIGLEVHIQLITNSKLFCSDVAKYGALANENTSAITLAHPGTLPHINKHALEQAITLGLSLDCSITHTNYFSRKHYLYPDLPRGFQTTQHINPICEGGSLTFYSNNETKVIQIHHIHLEEDAGKSIHTISPTNTALDYNRAGTPLCELVTEPCIYSSNDAANFLTELRKIVRWIGVSDGNMEEGSLRCDANVSIKPKGTTTLGTRVEVKNLNSIKFVKKAIDYEVKRMEKLLNNNEMIEQETRSFDATNETTFSLRNKEDANDYRYFIEPDLAPTIISDDLIFSLKNKMPKLPMQLIEELQNNYQLSFYDATLLVEDIDTFTFYKETVKQNTNSKAIANFINGPIKKYCNEHEIGINKINFTPNQLSEIINLIDEGSINFSNASGKLFHSLLNEPNANVANIVQQLNLVQDNNSDEIGDFIKIVIEKHSAKVTEYKKGKKGLIGFFTGEVVKLSKGKASPQIIQELLQKELN